MRLQSLNIARPRLIEYKGEEVLTGIYKRATEASLMARKLNIDGDGQADLSVHGGIDKAVYAFPSEHYAYYQAELGQPPWEPGQFGENLTTEGLLESSLRIGDRLRIGEALFEVSQPRSPCYKFAIKMGTARALAVCINSARTGFYLRVLTEGWIRAGDDIEIERQDAAAPTVEEIHRLYYLDKLNLDGLTRALNCKWLAGAFKIEFERRAGKLAGAPVA